MRLFTEAIRKINALFSERRTKYVDGNPNDIVAEVFRELVKNTDDGRALNATHAFDMVFDVESRIPGNPSRVVDLDEKTCSCMMFQDLGYPCVHACIAALTAGVDIETLCIFERRIGALRMVYANGIVPVDIDSIEPEDLDPPTVQRQRGRPMIRRIRRQIEEQKRANFCSLCHERGHNKRTCPLNVA